MEKCASITASHPAKAGAASASSRLCAATSPRVSAVIAAGTTRVCKATSGSPARAANSVAMDSTLGSNVASSPNRRPAARAARNMASFGFSTGIGSAAAAVSIAGPKAEQVKRMPSAPIAAP